MAITPKKNQYALRAIFELAKYLGLGPKKISEIAEAQARVRRELEEREEGEVNARELLKSLRSRGLADRALGLKKQPHRNECCHQ